MIKKFYAYISIKDLKEMKIRKKSGVFKIEKNYIHLSSQPYKGIGLKTRKVIVKILKKKRR